MKEYHFQKKERDFDSTVRLDDINEKVKQIEENNIEDELGDANAFLDAFESEKFDAPLEDEEEETPEQDDTIILLWNRIRKTVDDLWKIKIDLGKKRVRLLPIVAGMALLFGFLVVRIGYLGASESSSVMLVESVSGKTAKVYDISAAERKTIRLSEETEGKEGNTPTALKMGDVVTLKIAKDGETALFVEDGNAAVKTVEATGLTVDETNKRLLGDAASYRFTERTLFFYQDEELLPKDLEPCDLLAMKLVDDVVWSVEVLEYHGYIVVENAENIKEGTLRFEEGEPIPLTEGLKIPVRAGQHQITVLGANIETRTDTVFVEPDKKFVYDLSKAQEKLGVIIIDANVTEYKLYINGNLMESPAVLPMGEYDVVILKNGYIEWNETITLDQDSVTLQAELTKEIEYGTFTIMADVEGATVYIDDESYGVAPMQVNLPYGSYLVRVEKEGYHAFQQTAFIHSSESFLQAEMEKIQ